MPVQMIELEEVQMIEVSDQELERTGGGKIGATVESCTYNSEIQSCGC